MSARRRWIPTSGIWRSTANPCVRVWPSWPPVPAANLLLAVLLYALVNWVGLEEPRAVLAAPAVTGSVVAQAGLHGGERVTAVQVGQEAPQEVRSFEHLRWALTQAALEKQDARITWQRAPGDGGANDGLALVHTAEHRA
jgi:regulator of sigma E protease